MNLTRLLVALVAVVWMIGLAAIVAAGLYAVDVLFGRTVLAALIALVLVVAVGHPRRRWR